MLSRFWISFGTHHDTHGSSPIRRVWGEDHVFGRKLMLESCRRSSDVNFHFWLWAASSTNVRYRALRAAWTISVSSKSLMLRKIGTWKLMGARSIRNVIRTCAFCSPRASTSIRATVILNLLIPSLGLLLRKRHPFADDFSPRCPRGQKRCRHLAERTASLI